MCDKITNRNSYLQNFGQSKQGEALRYAHEIRKFEIDLYWRRAAYFWTFIGVAFAAVFVVEEHKSAAGLRFLVACVGLVFSVAWLQANRGSKYWQDNWEQQVDILEDEITGPIYKITANVPERVTRLSLLKDCCSRLQAGFSTYSSRSGSCFSCFSYSCSCGNRRCPLASHM